MNGRWFVVIMLLQACASAPVAISPLPLSKEATYLENIEGKDDRFIAWGIGEDESEAEIDALKSALYVTMCGGAAGNHVAVLSTAESMRHADFIEGFFSKETEWRKFVRSTNQGRIDPDKRIRLSNGTIKLGVDVVVGRKSLEEYLTYMKIRGNMKIGG